MKFWCWRLGAWAGLGVSLAGALGLPAETFKPIRLRDQALWPAAAFSQPARALAAPEPLPASGLWLVQFRAAPRPEWREQLQALGVELLRYVPENAFVARARNARADAVRALDFVTFVGEYRSDFKLEARVREAAQQFGQGAPPQKAGATSAASPQRLNVSVLLAPGVSDAEAATVQNRFTQLRQQARLRTGRVLRGELPLSQLEALAADPNVLWIEPAPKLKLFDEVASRIVGGDGPMHQTLVQSLGYDGSGVTVAVADSGLDSGDTNSMHADLAGRVVALFHYGAPGQLDDAADEHGHGTHVAGIIAGNGATGQTDENGFLYGLGVAPGARLIGQRIFDAAGYFAEPPSFEALTRDAKRAGADIGSNSWGEDNSGFYDLSAMEFDELVRDADALAPGDQPYILEFSAGNSGPAHQTIATPAVAKNVIATGASQNDRFNLPLEEFAIYADGREAMADFSSRGPAADGRIKPDLVAPGTWIASLRSVFANDDFAWWPISDEYSYQGGTSQAGPHVSGAAAVFVHYWRSTRSNTPSPALVKAALINAATDLDGLDAEEPVPNHVEGWGRVDVAALIEAAQDYDFTDQSAPLSDGAVFERRVLIGSSAQPLKVTLAWTDVPGFPAAGAALVNDLDLEVISPDGHRYRGNQFDAGESVPDPTASDTLNNVEGVLVSEPVPGEYLVRVRATRVVEDARRDTGPVDQDFALVVSGRFATPGVGVVTFDRRVYRAPDRIRLTLADYDLAGQPGATVLVRSSTEPAGEAVALLPAAPHGVFTGAVWTATGPAMPDGQLQLAHGDVIQAVYADAQPASNRLFSALADLVPPAISNVWATNRFGQSVAGWNTDEPSRAEIYYGVLTPNHALTNRALATAHEFVLSDLGASATARFFVVAADEAGNRATNNNAGQLFTVTNVQSPQILLVDSFADFYVLGFLILPAPPLSGYTDALDQLGVSYAVFDARSNAIPTLPQLQAHRCVIWRLSDLQPPPPALALAISNYVRSGGSLLLASMEAPTRLAEAGLRGFITNTLRVLAYTEDQPVNQVRGVPGEPLGYGMDTPLDYTPYEPILELANVSNPSDWIVPDTNAAPILVTDGGPVVGLRAPRTGVDLPGRVVFLSFPLDAVPMGSPPANNRSGLLQNIFKFLAPQTNTSLLTLDSDVYSLPGRAVVEVEDADVRGQGQLTVRLSSLTRTNWRDLPLFETARPGLFRGSVFFVPTNSPAPNSFVAIPDEFLQFDY
ncbi:MAG: S8 family serine peptidase, partial [Verrucomicrobiales bacterium]|nr:S8 family serine peptidase [Verrucomicrobiales bacterium]